MLVGMGCNHALLVKLADRLHDMRTLGALPAAQRNLLAQETVDVWAPLANRLGVWGLKAQLEDLAFKQLYPAQVCGGVWCGGGVTRGRCEEEAAGCLDFEGLLPLPGSGLRRSSDLLCP